MLPVALDVWQQSCANWVLRLAVTRLGSLMKSLQLAAKRSKQHRYPMSDKPSVIESNRLNRQFNPDRVNTYWSGDITYIRNTYRSRLALPSGYYGFIFPQNN